MGQLGGYCPHCAKSTHRYFSVLDHDGLKKLDVASNCRLYRAGAVLFRQGEEADEIFCLSGGIVKLVHVSRGGRETLIGLVGAGTLVGLSAALGPGTHPYTAEVVTDGIIGCFPKATLVELVDSSRGLAPKLIELIAAEAHDNMRRMALLGEHRLAPKLAALLLDLAGRTQQAEVGDGLRRRDLAAMCGVRLEAIVRCLSRWKKDGIVASRGGPIRLIDPRALEAIAAGS